MMDNSVPPTPGSLLGLSGVGGGKSVSQLSPYRNVNPAYLQTQTPEFIFNQVGILAKEHQKLSETDISF